MFGKNDIPKSINFMEPVTRPTDVWANAYEWMFQVGKYMLIVVEIVALAVFVARFIIDGNSNDLTKDINDQVSILSGSSWQQDSITYENIQDLLGDIERISKGQKNNSVIIDEIRNGIPYGLLVQSFSFSNGRVSLSLQTTDFKAFKDYESAIKNNANYEDVSFSTTKDDSVFDIRVSFVVTEVNG
jgi:hypothetical protein